MQTSTLNDDGTPRFKPQLTICTGCDINHVENCPNCFGFGLYRSFTVGKEGELYPVTASEAHFGFDPARGELTKCMTCGSGIRGVPKPEAN